MKISLDNIIWKEGEYFVAQCLNVEVNSFGNTKEEAHANLREALELYFEDKPKSEIVRIENPEIYTTELEQTLASFCFSPLLARKPSSIFLGTGVR